jgi:Rrf2 family iron-sulfur cluster assembly transcriptional regulator
MISLSKHARLGLEAVIYVAEHAPAQAVSSKVLAERLMVSQRYLEPLLQRLVRAGILASQRGPHGGYVLAKERRKLTLAAVLLALQEASEPTELLTPALVQIWQEIQARVTQELASRTLDEVVPVTAPASVDTTPFII